MNHTGLSGLLGFLMIAAITTAATPETTVYESEAFTTSTQILVIPWQTSKLPSGWDDLIDAAIDESVEKLGEQGLTSWGLSQIVPAMKQRSRRLERLVQRRQWKESAGQAADLHRLSIHLVDRLVRTSPPSDSTQIHTALRIEVLLQSLQESCSGENPGRARLYIRQVTRLVNQLEATIPKSMDLLSPSPESDVEPFEEMSQ